MPITIVSASKDIEALMAAKPTENVKNIQPKDAKKIRRQIATIQSANSLVEIMNSVPAWRVHRYNGQSSTWSFDVGGPTRLLMEWDESRKEVSNLRFENPH
jgi:plasmid maintenance system killer protein